MKRFSKGLNINSYLLFHPRKRIDSQTNREQVYSLTD